MPFILPEALKPLTAYAQFLIYKLVWDEEKQKYNKIPLSPHTLQAYPKGSNWQQDPTSTASYDHVAGLLPQLPEGYGVGFLFTPSDPFFFVDIDKCLQPDNTWSPIAVDIMGRLDGAAVEVSQSGRGLHIFGVGSVPDHSNKNIPLNLEMYTQWRFVALTGLNAIGSAAKDCSVALPHLINAYFTKREGDVSDWTTEPVPGYTGPADDEELIAKAISSSSAGSVFGGRATFSDLFTANEDALAAAYPDTEGHRTYDGSSADAALAQHLAFWTGKNCERIERIMKMSALVRDKWDREDYLVRTITRAVGMQTAIYSTGGAVDTTLADQFGAVKLRASSDAQRNYGESIRARKLAEVADDPETARRLARIPTAKVFIENEAKSAQELAAMVTPVGQACDPLAIVTEGPKLVSGYQYLAADQQLEYFKGCVYVQDIHRIFTPKGALLRQDQFNATYGGYVFQLDESGDKVTRKAWEAFTESQIIRYPKAEGFCFRPELPSGKIIEEGGVSLINTYIPVEIPQLQGDVSKFTDFLARLLPDARDREILLTYMAAMVQNPGRKFQWWPVLQGTEGNGKTAIVSALSFAVGSRYTHCPNVDDIAKSGNKFNGWVRNKLFIGMEEVYVPNRRDFLEAFKTTVTNDRLPIENKGIDQVMADNRANGLMCTNHKDGVPVSIDARRYCIFYTAQQNKADLARDGMDGLYFPDLYDWLKGRGAYEAYGVDYGFRIVNWFLRSYAVSEEFNPAGSCQRAPETSSTHEAVSTSMGGIEQDIMEAIEENRHGFAGGWISSVHLDKLLQNARHASKVSHHKRRDLLAQLGYVWHPALPGGRVNNPIAIDEHKKPRLYIRKGHIHMGLATGAEVVKAYVDAQTDIEHGAAKEVFGR